jgi:hypothetical protein
MDYVETQARLQYVRDQLRQYSGPKKEQGSTIFVLCPFHAEKTPSFRIFASDTTQNPGFGKCYGCGGKGGWDKIAPLIGLKPYKREKPQEEYANFNLLPDEAPEAEVVEDFVQEEFEFRELPKGKVWREISTDLLIDIGAKACTPIHPEHGRLKPRLWLPVHINGELRGYIKARYRKHPEYPSYINAKGQWSKTHGLFPFDPAIKLMRKLGSRTIVLVEGQRDALRLLAMGIPAMCILGTQSWSDTKAKLLELAGVRRLILFMDGDDAGIGATEMLKPRLVHMFKVTVIKLWSLRGSPYLKFEDEENPSKAAKAAGVSLWDPGNAPEWILHKIKEKYFA